MLKIIKSPSPNLIASRSIPDQFSNLGLQHATPPTPLPLETFHTFQLAVQMNFLMT